MSFFTPHPSSVLRRVLFVLVLLGFLAPTASAQLDVRLGIKQGANFATLSGDWKQATALSAADAELNRRIGFVFGGLLVLDPAGPLAVQPEVLAIWKGARGLAGQTETRTTLNYLEVPVLLKYTPFASGGLTASLLAGPTVGLATKAQRNRITRDGAGEVETSTRTNLDGSVRSLDAGLAGGVELGYRFSNKVKFMTEVRYRRSFTSAFNGGTGSSGTTSSLQTQNQSLALTLGLVYSAVGGFW